MIAGEDDCALRVTKAGQDAKQNGQELVALVGAGFSCNASDEFPLWNEISDWVGHVFTKKLSGKRPDAVLGSEADDFTVAAEWYFYMLGAHSSPIQHDICLGKKMFISTVDTELERASYLANLAAHEALLDKFDTIYTTNWDCLLEKTLDIKNVSYTKYQLKKTPTAPRGEWDDSQGKIKTIPLKKIIKYHGCCKDPEGYSIVASRTDYDNRLLRVSGILHQSTPTNGDYDQILSQALPILVGYSYKDINIRFVFSQVHMTTPKIKIINIVVDNPAHYSEDRLAFFKDVYGIETLFLFPKDDEYHKLRGRWEYARQHKGRGIDEALLKVYKKDMVDYSRDKFASFFPKIS